MKRTAPIASLCVLAILAPTAAALAADTSMSYYTPPKLLKRGTNTAAVEGVGTVMVKVLVNKDGTFKVQGIMSSTNHGDDKAALEIANSSTYRPAKKGSTPQTAFYDFRLNFTSSGAATEVDPSELGQIERMIHVGNFSGAKTKVDAYLQAHPGEARAEVDLGLADAFLNDFEGAAAAFDKGGPIPQNYRPVAGKSYAEAAISFAKAKAGKSAVAAGRKAVDLVPSFGTYNALGFAEFAAAEYTASAADLEKARGLAVTEKASDQTRALVDTSLTAAYVNAGNIDAALKIAAEATHLDPSTAKSLNVILTNYFGGQARDLFAAKKFAEAAAIFEQGAAAVPASASFLYAKAATAYLLADHPDNLKAKADADRAIALDPANGLAYYAAAISLANQGKSKDALDFLKKADDAAKTAGDADLSAQVQTAVKRLSGAK